MFFFQLPPEIQVKISSYLNPIDLSAFGETCRSGRALAHDRVYWRKRLSLHFPGYFAKTLTKEPHEIDYRTLFIEAYQQQGESDSGDEYLWISPAEKRIMLSIKEDDMVNFIDQVKSLEVFSQDYKDILSENSLLNCVVSRQYKPMLTYVYQLAQQVYTTRNDLNVLCTDDEGRTLLHWAVMCKRPLEEIETLIERGADLEAKTSEGLMTLHFAALSNHIDVIRWLAVDKATRVNEFSDQEFDEENSENNSVIDDENTDEDGVAALTIAACYGHVEGITALLALGAEVNYSDKLERAALHMAIERGYLDVVDQLLNAGADVNLMNSDGRGGLHLVLDSACYYDIFERLLKTEDVDVNLQSEGSLTPLHFAVLIEEDDIRFSTALLSMNDIDVNAQDVSGDTPLHSAVSEGNISIIRLLLNETRVNINAVSRNGSALHSALGRRRIDVAKELLSTRRVDLTILDVYDKTVLHLTAKAGYADIAREIINIGTCDVNAREGKGCTALHLAVEKGHTKTVAELLLANGIDVGAQDANGWTALHHAASDGSLDIMGLLLAVPFVDINAGDKYRTTPLMYAAASNQLEAVRLLLATGRVDVNVVDDGGETALSATTHPDIKEVIEKYPKLGDGITLPRLGGK